MDVERPQQHGGEGVPVQGTLLRLFHGSASFYQGHGSCVSDSTQDGGTTSSLPGRLVASGILTRAGPPCSEDSAPTLQAPRECCQLGEVSGDSDSADGISGSHPGLTAFGASPALKRVEKLLSIGDVFLSCVSQPVSSWLELLGVLSSMFQLVPGGRLRSSLQACGLRMMSSSRSMPGSSWRSKVLSGGLLHFSPVLSGGLRRQIDSRVVSAEPRRDSFFFSELRRSEDSPLGGGSVCGDFPTGYYGETQCASGCSFSPKPGLGLRVDAEAGGLQGFVQEVAGVRRPVCNVSKSQLFLIFLSLPQSQCYGTDALLRNWNGWQACAFPPWSLIPAGLKKLRSSSGVLLTIVAPYWPQRPWFPDLLDLVVDGPVALPQSRDLLRQPHFHRFHLGVSRLCLHAW